MTAATFGLMLAAGGTGDAAAATVSWVNDLGGMWVIPYYWSSNPALPGPADDVVADHIPAISSLIFDRNTYAVRSLYDSANLSVLGGSLTVAGDTFIGGALTMGSPDMYAPDPVLNSNGTMTINGGGTWVRGTIGGTGGGNINLAAGSTFTIRPVTYVALNNQYVHNAGTINFDATGGAWYVNATGTTIDNLPGGVINADTGAGAADTDGIPTGGTLNNSGTINKTGARRWTYYSPLNNAGVVNVLQGTLNLSAGGTQTGVFNLSPGTTLQFGGGEATLAPSVSINGPISVSGGTLTVAPGAPLPAAITLSGGTLRLTGSHTASSSFAWTGGTLAGTGTTTIPVGVNLSASGGINLDQRTLENAGTLNVNGSGTSSLTSATFRNLAGATLNVDSTSNDPYTFGGYLFGSAGDSAVDNAGTINKTGSKGWSIGIPFNNSGTVNVTAGTLAVSGGGTQTGTINVAPGASFRFDNGTHTIAPSATFTGQITLGGESFYTYYPVLLFTGDNVLPAGFTWLKGTLSGAGKTTVPAGQSLVIAPGTGPSGLDGRTLENAGSVTLGAPGGAPNTMSLYHGAAINNLSGATFNIADSAVGSEPGTAFNNAGTVNAAGTNTTLGVAVNNTGTLNVASGTFNLSGGGTQSGAVTVAAGAVANFSDGTHLILPSATFGGAGKVRLSNGTFQFSGDNTATGNFEWTGGTISGDGKTVVPAGTSMAISPAYQIYGTTPVLSGRTLENAGTIVLNAPTWMNSVTLKNGAAINNLAGATFTIVDAVIWSTDPTVFTNAGTVNAGGATSSVGTTFNNTGTLNVTAGTLTLSGGGTHAGTLNVAPSAVADFSAGTYAVSPGATFIGSGKVRLTNSATLQFTGDNTVTGNFEWTGGTLSGAGKSVVPAGVTLPITPNYQTYGTTPVLSGRTLENAGTITLSAASWQNSLNLANGAAISNLPGATFNISDASLGFLSSPTGIAFNNAGTVNAGGTTSSLGVEFNNTGTLNVTSGTLTLSRGGTYTGTINLAAGTIANFTFGTHVIAPSASFAGAGLVRLSDSATFQFAGDYTVPGNFEWTGGTISGTGKSIVPAGATLPITPAYQVYGTTPVLSGRTLENAGAITLSATSWMNNMTLKSGAAINNLAGATFTIADATVSSDPGTAFNNAGTINAGGTTSNLGTALNNTGTLNVQQGALSITGTVTQLSAGTLTGGTWNVANNAALTVSTGLNVTTIGPAASVTLGGPNAVFAKINSLANVQGSFTLSGGRSFTTTGALTNSGAIAVGAGSTLKVAGTFASSGTLTNSGTIDIVGNRMILNYASASPADWLRGQLQSGRNGGAWAGAAGVVSSTAAGDALKRKAIGYAEAADLGVTTWAGVAVDATALLTKVTWYGDANLDGKVNADDYALLDRSMAKGLTGAHWADGDFDYSGTVDQADYLLADRVYGQQVGVLSPELLADREARFGSAYVTELIAAVPEPSILAPSLATLGGLLTSRRRRRI